MSERLHTNPPKYEYRVVDKDGIPGNWVSTQRADSMHPKGRPHRMQRRLRVAWEDVPGE